jgi:hypothetical protein
MKISELEAIIRLKEINESDIEHQLKIYVADMLLCDVLKSLKYDVLVKLYKERIR